MIEAAIVGLGWWGRYIVESLKRSEKIRVVRAIEADPAAARDFAAGHGLSLTGDLRDALDDAAIGAVILATPHSLHEDQVCRAAAAGKHVFCEKPLALSKAGAERSILACEDAGVVLGIGHERRFEPSLMEIARMVEAGELGTIMHVESNFSHDRLAKVDAADWRASTVEAPAAGMTGVGIHLTDAYIGMFGEIAQVYAQSARRVMAAGSGDVLSVEVRFKCGATGSFGAILATPLLVRYQVFGSDAWVEARNTTHPDTSGPIYLTVCRKGGAPRTSTYPWEDTVRANLEAFADAVAGAAPYPISRQEMLHNIAVFEAVLTSVETGQVVALS